MKLNFCIVLFVSAFFHSTAYAECGNINVEKLARNIFESKRDIFNADPSEVKSLLTSEFYKVLESEFICKSQGELCAIEADPWLSAQDGEISEPISFSITSQTAFNASVKMSYVFELSETKKENRAVIFQFLKGGIGSCWLLADFITPNEGSLKEHLEEWQLRYGKTL